jgi:hydrogenase maturation protease
VLVDAVASGADPGTIFRLDLHDHSIPSFLFHYSTHGFNLSDTVELARLLGKLPPKLVVFGIEGMDFSQGQGLTEDVAVAIERVVRSLLDYIGNNLEAAGQPGEVLSHA